MAAGGSGWVDVVGCGRDVKTIQAGTTFFAGGPTRRSAEILKGTDRTVHAKAWRNNDLSRFD